MPRQFRGSRRHMRQMQRRESGLKELWWLFALLLFVLFVLLPWLAKAPVGH